jgi:hypothetical protein
MRQSESNTPDNGSASRHAIPSRGSRGRRWGLPAALGFVGVLAIQFGAHTLEPATAGDIENLLEFPEERAAPASKGELVLSHFGPSDPMANGFVHRTVFVPGRAGVRMDDNDLRGFLDGTFVWGWNQPGQIHVRFGRRPRSPRYGEHEVFRVLQLWRDVRLPPKARVSRAALVLHVEMGPDHPVHVLLYRVNRSWNPGEGGIQQDNVSPPARGEAWWNAARFGEEGWGLPGVGYYGSGPDADTPATALGDARYFPGDSLLVFSGAGLNAHVQEQASSGGAVQLLLKTSDVDEDRVGSLVTVYSADYGDSRNDARKPTLEVHWSSPGERALLREWMVLEHGRATTAGPFPLPSGGWVSAEFATAEGYEAPLVEVRGGETPSDTASWTAPSGPLVNEWSWLQVRIRALHDPVPVGSPFSFDIRDTWVLEEPSQAVVRVAFLSPSGVRSLVSPTYQGRYTWRVSFVPNEVGAWRYRWVADFAEAPTISPVGRFDVIATERAQLFRALRELIDDLEEAAVQPRREATARREILYGRFLRLEREVLRMETPESFHSHANRLLPLLRRSRELISGAPVPDSIPLMVSGSHQGRTEHLSGTDAPSGEGPAASGPQQPTPEIQRQR